MIFPAPNQSMAFIRLRLIFQRQTSGRSRQCLLPFWRTIVVTYSSLLVRLAAKGSQQLSHWYDIVTIDLKQADPGAIMVKFAILAQIAPSHDTPERFFLLREKMLSEHSNKVPIRLTISRNSTRESRKFVGSRANLWQFVYFHLTAWIPRLRSPTPIMAPGQIILVSRHVELDKFAVLSSAAQMINMIQTVSNS